MKEMEDTALVSGSFLRVFFIDVNNIRNSLTGYRSIILRLEAKTGSKIKDIIEKDFFKNTQINEDLRTGLIQWSDDIRNNVERCQIGIDSIKKVIPDIDIKKLNDLYEKIVELFAPNLDDVKEYAFEINRKFAESTIERKMNEMEKFYEQYSQK